MILANKADLCELPETAYLVASNQEPISPGLDQWQKYPVFKQGLQLAKRQNALFYPVSAKMGLNLPHAFKRFARRLKQLEDEEMKHHLQERTPMEIKARPVCCSCCPCYLL
nr:unnamed protein product [Spirometra erinaceieuropaei]